MSQQEHPSPAPGVLRARPLATGCAYCNRSDRLQIGEGCNAAYFCYEEHKTAMGLKHSEPCQQVRELRPHLVQFPLRDMTGAVLHPHDADIDILMHYFAYDFKWTT